MRHPLHPAFVHFPIAAWSFATAADFAGAWFDPGWWTCAGWLHVAGTATALAAMATGAIEFVKLPADSPALKFVARHMVFVLLAWFAYATSLVLRVHDSAIHAPGAAGLATSVAGFVLLCVAGFLGGKLVYRHGVGVREA